MSRFTSPESFAARVNQCRFVVRPGLLKTCCCSDLARRLWPLQRAGVVQQDQIGIGLGWRGNLMRLTSDGLWPHPITQSRLRPVCQVAACLQPRKAGLLPVQARVLVVPTLLQSSLGRLQLPGASIIVSRLMRCCQKDLNYRGLVWHYYSRFAVAINDIPSKETLNEPMLEFRGQVSDLACLDTINCS